jgi:adenine phosphoribosyltransferase
MWWNWIVMKLADAISLIRDIPDYPKPGILFKDITPLLANPTAYSTVIKSFATQIDDVDVIAGIEARGFIFAAAIALEKNAGFVPFRKSGKLPFETIGAKYGLEYGEDEIEVHIDAFANGKSVVIVDDVLATGGTIAAALELAERSGAVVKSVHVLFEISGLGGREVIAKRFPNVLIKSLVTS